MNSAMIFEQLQCIAGRLTTIQADDNAGLENIFKDLLHCEADTAKFYDELKGEMLRIHNEEVTNEEFMQRVSWMRNKILGTL